MHIILHVRIITTRYNLRKYNTHVCFNASEVPVNENERQNVTAI